jgi:hypothetical protein
LKVNENDHCKGEKIGTPHTRCPIEFKVMKQILAVCFGEFLGLHCAPLMGGAVAAGCFRFVIAPLMAAKAITPMCSCESCKKDA